ncbi:MAG: hypothetical protein M3O06_10110, partial [Pseudomonadota bacterium]|nr:hypothetical protein [Pseudomonadota bacterium]
MGELLRLCPASSARFYETERRAINPGRLFGSAVSGNFESHGLATESAPSPPVVRRLYLRRSMVKTLRVGELGLAILR